MTRYIKHPDDPNARVIWVTNNDSPVWVDAEDYDRVADLAWWANKDGYIQAVAKRKFILLHRLITNAAPDVVVDHINNDTYDNRQCNLRPATLVENAANRRLPLGTSGFRGVRERMGRYEARVGKGGRIHVGTYETPEEAARARDEAAIEMYGDFAVLNFEKADNA